MLVQSYNILNHQNALNTQLVMEKIITGNKKWRLEVVHPQWHSCVRERINEYVKCLQSEKTFKSENK